MSPEAPRFEEGKLDIGDIGIKLVAHRARIEGFRNWGIK